MEYFLGFVFICLVLGAVGIVYGKGKDEKINIPSGRLGRAMVASMDVSEPVISIVESFKEKGRWKITDQTDPYSLGFSGFSRSHYSFSVEDTKTGENYTLKSDSFCWLAIRWRLAANIRFPRGMVPHYLPSWMTEAEKKYVCENFEIISNKVAERIQLVGDRYRTKDEKQAKVNQEKERQRLISIYCKEGV